MRLVFYEVRWTLGMSGGSAGFLFREDAMIFAKGVLDRGGWAVLEDNNGSEY